MMTLALSARTAKLSGLIALTTVFSLACGTEKDGSTVSDDTAAATFHEGKVSACPDGDTCNVKLDDDGSTMKVRFIGIDAPESRGGDDGTGQPLGQEAKLHLNALIKGKHVRVRVIAKDKYDRQLGEVYLGATLVNVEMLKKGLAQSYIWNKDAIDALKYRKAENKAKTAHAGIWALEDYESPEDFRRRMRQAEGE